MQIDTEIPPDDDDFVPALDVVLPDPDTKLRAEGWRLHVYQEYAEGNVYVSAERVLPEKVADPNAHRIRESRRILLHPDEVHWLRDQLNGCLDRAALESGQRDALKAELEQMRRGK